MSRNRRPRQPRPGDKRAASGHARHAHRHGLRLVRQNGGPDVEPVELDLTRNVAEQLLGMPSPAMTVGVPLPVREGETAVILDQFKGLAGQFVGSRIVRALELKDELPLAGHFLVTIIVEPVHE